MRAAMRFATIFVLLPFAGCGQPQPVGPAPPPPPPPSSAPPAPRTLKGGPRDDVAQAMARVTRAAFEADIRAIARPRHHRAAPEGLGEVAAYVERELSHAGFSVRREPVTFDGATFDNIIGERAGEAGGSVVVGCAHYDAVVGTAGADDNASGTAALLAMARALGPLKTPRAVRLVAFAFEEEGLVGSAHHVAGLDPAARKAIRAVINLEMIGYADKKPKSQHYPREIEAIVSSAFLPSAGDFIGVIGTSDASFVLDAFEDARKYVPDLRVVPLEVPRGMVKGFPDLRRSDHARFWDAEVPAVMIGDTGEYRTPHYHKPSDTVATLDLDFATDVARWSAAAAALLARQPSQ